MEEKKSNVISIESRKQSDFQRKLSEAREISRRLRDGGRCLDAVWERADLTTGEKAVLCQIGAFHDYKSLSFFGPVKLSLDRIMGRTSLSLYGVRKIIKALQAKRLVFVTRTKRRSGADDKTIYQLSPKLFSDYAKTKVITRKVDATQLQPPVAELPKEDATQLHLPATELPTSGCNSVAPLNHEITHRGCNSVAGGVQLSCSLFPYSSSSGSKTNPPYIPPSGKGGPSTGRISRYDKTNYDHLLTLSLGTWEQSKRNRHDSDLWIDAGYETFPDLLASYYPRLVLRLMAKLGPKFDQGIGRRDRNFWHQQMQQEVERQGAEADLASITDLPFLEMRELIQHGKSCMAHTIKGEA